MKSEVVRLFACLYAAAVTCVFADFPFRNTSLPWEERVNDLVSRLSIGDITLQMAKGGAGKRGGPAPAIPRLGIKPYSWNTECLRGDAQAGEATAFPQALGLAAAYWPKLIKDVAKATGEEVRAKYNDFTSKGQYGDHKGISCFSPVINIMRHPLWGRNQESYGEDPYLSGVFATNFVEGLQGADPRYIQANAGCKHFDAYAGPENIPVSRMSFDAKVSERDLRLTFFPAFRQCVKAGTYSIMCSYNSVNGIPACTHKKLLTDVLRTDWKFEGYVVSDWEALRYMISRHHYYNTSLEAAVGSVSAGCNLDFSDNNPDIYLEIASAVEKKLLSEDLVRERVKPLFMTRMRLGEFDPPGSCPYNQYNMSLVQSPAHRDLAVLAAAKTFVLLKNEDGILPLRKHFNKIAIVGPMANNFKQLFGDYGADPDPKYGMTPLKGLKRLADFVNYAAGCEDNRCQKYDSSALKAAVQGTQLVVVCVGTGQELESEGNDRSAMDLAGKQKQLILDAAAVAASSGTPMVLLVFSAGPVNITFADANQHIAAIMQCFFPAQAAGQALYDVLTLSKPEANPAGRLPYTWYSTKEQIPSMTDYSMTGRTYRYFNGTALYPFGYGLSYTKFSYLKGGVTPTITAGSDVNVTGQVQNIGSLDGDEVVQVYIDWLDTTEAMPQRQLVAFDRFFIPKGKVQGFQFIIKAEQMAVWTDTKGFVIQSGRIAVCIGGQQPNQKRNVGSNIIHTGFEIKGTRVLGTI